MEEYTYIEILIEDKSGGILMEKIMEKYVADKKDLTYRIHSFKGIGKIPAKAVSLSQIKSHRLLTDLPVYLRGIGASLKNLQGNKAVFVILDSDEEDCSNLKHRLLQVYHEMEISIQVFFCIAIEEMEEWLLVDHQALLKAYPMAKRSLLQKYVQDSITGTWEVLADIVYKGGLQGLRRNASSYYEIGMFKCECAAKIGEYLDLKRNASPSFNYFIGKLNTFYGGAT